MPYGTVNADVIGTSVAGANLGAGNASLMKNRIINGAMVVAQRGTSATVNDAAAFYTTDRWECQGASGDGVYTIAQSSTAPAGFSNSLLATVTTADSSLGATQSYSIRQKIEGYNIADLGFGTASAKTVTVSFWVRSSLTGTFGGALINGGFSRSYPFTYTISTADTWEQKTVTIAGDTTGTWATDNTLGMTVTFALGQGSSRLGTAGAWVGANNQGATGQTNIIATSGATFYITGVQLEVGSSATGYEYRQYGQELALCQRYYWQTPTSDLYHARSASGIAYNTTGIEGVNFSMPVTMRTTPSFSLANAGFYSPYVGRVPNSGTVGVYQGSTDSLYLNNANNGSGFGANYSYFISSTSTTSAKFNAEL